MFRRALTVAAATALAGAGLLAAGSPAQAAIPANCTAVVIGWHGHASCTWPGGVPWKLQGTCPNGAIVTSATVFGTGNASVFCYNQNGDVRNLSIV